MFYCIEIGSRLFMLIIVNCESHECKESVKEGEGIRFRTELSSPTSVMSVPENLWVARDEHLGK